MKRIIALLCIICICISHTGCTTKEEIEAFEKAENQGRINAVNYIQEKYGFSPKILKVQGDYREADLFPATYYPENPIEVTMSYQGKEFMVEITGTKPTTEGKDNYQFEEIFADLETRLLDVAHQYCENAHVEISYGNDMHHAFYDGTNLDQILQEQCSGQLYIATAGMDLEALDTVAMMKELQINGVIIVNCADPETYQIIPYYGKKSVLMNYVREYGIYLEDYLEIEDDGSKAYTKIRKIRCGDLVVIPDSGTYCNVTETEIDPEQWRADLSLDGEPRPYGGYTIETDSQKLSVYFDGSALEGASHSGKFRFGARTTMDEKVSYDSHSAKFDGCWYSATTDYYGLEHKVELCFMEVGTNASGEGT